MKLVRVTRHLGRRNFSARGVSRRVAALRYVPSVLTTSMNNHGVDPVMVAHMVRDMCACEALSFAGQVAIVTLSLSTKSVSGNLSISDQTGINPRDV